MALPAQIHCSIQGNLALIVLFPKLTRTVIAIAGRLVKGFLRLTKCGV
jgi:hypothetical protein